MVRSSFLVLTVVIAGAVCAPTALAGDATVPDVVGLSLEEATGLLAQAGFEPTTNYVPGKVIGKVISQEPGGLATRTTGDPVNLTVVGPTPKPGPGMPGPAATGPGKLPDMPTDEPPTGDPDAPPAGAGGMPDLGAPPTGVPGGDPMPSTPTPEPLTMPPADLPPTEDPGRATGGGLMLNGRAIPPGTMPNTSGPEVPGVLGQTTQQARGTLRRWQVAVEYTLGVPTLIGKVVNQRPHTGAPLAAGETVVLVVAVGQPPSPQHRSVPQVEGADYRNAARSVADAGFRVDARAVASPDASRGRVLQQTPLPGSLAVGGGAVRLLIGRGSGGAAGMPMDPMPSGPAPADPMPEGPTPVPANPGTSSMAAPGLQTPPAGESYPYRYGATFTWTTVRGASSYEWELQEELPTGMWKKVDSKVVKGTRYRPEKIDRGRYRWRVRAVEPSGVTAWSTFRRIYMY